MLVCQTSPVGKLNLSLLLERFSYDLEMKTREQNRNSKRMEIDVILQHDWLIEQCLLHIRVFFGGKTKRPCFDLFIHWLIKQITNTYRNYFSRSYESRSINESTSKTVPDTSPWQHFRVLFATSELWKSEWVRSSVLESCRAWRFRWGQAEPGIQRKPERNETQIRFERE